MKVEDIAQAMLKVADVKGVHDLHIWSITSNMHALTAHVVVDGNKTVYETEALLHNIEHMLEHKDIRHVTLQVESEKHTHEGNLLCNIKASPPDAHADHDH